MSLGFAILLRFDYYNRDDGVSCALAPEIAPGQAVQAAGRLNGRIFTPPGFSWGNKNEFISRAIVTMPISRAKWIKFMVSILLGNAVYFALSPHLPPAAQHHSWAVDLGTVVDFWFCLLIYGLLELGAFFRRAIARNRRPKE